MSMLPIFVKEDKDQQPETKATQSQMSFQGAFNDHKDKKAGTSTSSNAVINLENLLLSFQTTNATPQLFSQIPLG
jgi:hypothetical protein